MNSSTIRVIVVEDDFLVSEEIKRVLKGSNYEILGTPSNGEEAVQLVVSLKPDVVLMDIKMPKMDGLQAARLISEQYPVPIVFLSAYEADNLVQEASNAGVGAFLVKPPQIKEIDRAVTIAMARHKDLMSLRQLNSRLATAETRLKHIFNTSIPICLTSLEYDIIGSNESYRKIFDDFDYENTLVKCYDSRPGPACNTDSCPLKRILKGEKEVVCEPTKMTKDGAKEYFIVTARPLLDENGTISGIVECFQDITERKQLEIQRNDLIDKLEKSLDEIKTLRGILPICCHCKKIRNDDGYYEQLEAYFHKHSGVDFSHTICPQCVKIHYPEFCDS